MSFVDLLLSDLERYFFYTGAHGRVPKKYDLWRCIVLPRCLLVTIYRISHWFYTREWVVIGQAFTWLGFFLFGSEINCRTVIGPGLFIPHPNGIVIGAISIGRNAVIYHQVTIGAARIEPNMSNRPILEDNIVVGSGAKILGNFCLPEGCIVKANAVVTNRNYKDYYK